MKTPFTLVSTVFNEAGRLSQSLKDIAQQTVYPTEFIIVDAGSTDGTVEQISTWATQMPFKVTVIVSPGASVAKGRNVAIEAASTECIVSTDFGCRYSSHFLEKMITPLGDDIRRVVGGGYSVIENEIQTLAAKATFVLSNGYYCKPQPGFIPSSRAIAYSKASWEKAGKYPEWLTLAADDLVFGLVLLQQKASFYYVDDIVVYWGRHIKTTAYIKEAFRYGLGDGEAEVNKREIVVKTVETGIRYVSWLYCLIILGLGCKGSVSTGVYLGFIPFILGYKSYVRAIRYWWRLDHSKYTIQVLLFSFYLIERTRVSYIKGYIKGYFFKSKTQAAGASFWKKNYLSSL